MIRILSSISFILVASVSLKAQNFFVQENASIFIQEDAGMQFGGDLDNEGFIENNGTIDLYSDFNNSNIFNGALGILSFNGSEPQLVFCSSLELRGLRMNSTSTAQFQDDSVVVSEMAEFLNGILIVDSLSELVLQSNAEVLGGSDFSYVDGSITQYGTGYKFFPVGDSTYYEPIEFLDVRGAGPALKVEVNHPITFLPTPAEEVVGVSEHAMWKVQLVDGSFDSSLVKIDFMGADLQNFTNRNNINFLVSSPVIAATDSLGSPFESLGVSELIDTDSLTSGIVTSEEGLKIIRTNTAYIGVAKAPLIPPGGVVHIPNAFSPLASDVDNQTFRIFGEKILREDFELKIFNRFNVLVYKTEDYDEANTRGWDGTNQNSGKEEPRGLYYFSVQLRRENGELFKKEGPLYLIR